LLTSTALLGSAKLAAHETKTRAPLCANSVTDSASLSLTTPSAKVLSRRARTKTLNAKDLSREAKDKAPLGANNAFILNSLEEKALHIKAKLSLKGKAKIVASPCESTLSGEAILASPIAKKKAFKAKLKASQPKGANLQSP